MKKKIKRPKIFIVKWNEWMNEKKPEPKTMMIMMTIFTNRMCMKFFFCFWSMEYRIHVLQEKKEKKKISVAARLPAFIIVFVWVYVYTNMCVCVCA